MSVVRAGLALPFETGGGGHLVAPAKPPGSYAVGAARRDARPSAEPTW